MSGAHGGSDERYFTCSNQGRLPVGGSTWTLKGQGNWKRIGEWEWCIFSIAQWLEWLQPRGEQVVIHEVAEAGGSQAQDQEQLGRPPSVFGFLGKAIRSRVCV